MGPTPGEADQYVATVASMFKITLGVPPEDFHNSLDGYYFGEVALGRCRGVPQRFERTEGHLQRDGVDSVQVILDLDGAAWRGDYDGRAADHTRGDLRIVDMARPFDVVSEAYQTLNLMIPRPRLGVAAERDIHGLMPPPDAAGVRLLRSHLLSLWEVASELTIADGVAASRVLIALVAAILEQHAPVSPAPRRAPSLVRLAAARAWIDADPANPSLTPEGAQDRLGLSRSSLYRLFQPFGGIGAYILNRRLDLAFLAIADPAETRTIETVALAHGFLSHAHFGRAFRARFGIAPGQLRGYQRREPGEAGDPLTVLNWVGIP